MLLAVTLFPENRWKIDIKKIYIGNCRLNTLKNEISIVFRKIVDVDTCQASDISTKTSVTDRRVNSDPRGPHRTYYVSLLNIQKCRRFWVFRNQFSKKLSWPSKTDQLSIVRFDQSQSREPGISGPTGESEQKLP